MQPSSAHERTGRLDRGDGVELAWAYLPGFAPTIVFLPGFHSDMTGDKATALRDFCAATGQAMLRLDYSGHGASDGRFEDGTIGRWTDDARAVIESLTDTPLLLVGSSMGGWIALLLARRLADRVAGLIGVAAAPDFTERLIWGALSALERGRLERDGFLDQPSAYGEPYRITRALITEGRQHLLLDAPLPLACPVRLLQGQRDPDVPWQTALTLADCLTGDDVRVILVKDGDHRLSRAPDLALLIAAVAGLLGGEGA